jgi:hypothetical protein
MPTSGVGPNGNWTGFADQPAGAGGTPSGIISSMLWAARPAPATIPGQIRRFTDVGGGNPGPSGGQFLWSNGSRYRPMGGAVPLDEVDTPNIGTNVATEQQLNPNHVAIPAGLLQDYDQLMLELLLSKTGTADTATFRLRFGPLGTATDPVIATINGPAGSEQTLITQLRFKRLSATSIMYLGNPDTKQGMGGTSIALPLAPVAVSNMDSNAMFLSITAQMTTGGTDVPTLNHFVMLWLASDNN